MTVLFLMTCVDLMSTTLDADRLFISLKNPPSLAIFFSYTAENLKHPATNDTTPSLVWCLTLCFLE